jgi:hypothetical protein
MILSEMGSRVYLRIAFCKEQACGAFGGAEKQHSLYPVYICFDI